MFHLHFALLWLSKLVSLATRPFSHNSYLEKFTVNLNWMMYKKMHLTQGFNLKKINELSSDYR